MENCGSLAMRLMTLGLMLIGRAWWADTPARLGVVLAITLVFAALGHLVRGVTRSGAVAGAVVCFALFAGAGPGAFGTLLSVFALTWAATRIGLSRKQRLGTAERRDGRRASQVLANVGVAAVCAIVYGVLGSPLMLFAMTAALAEAAADTVSSECGQGLRGEARLITSFERVPAGTDGGVTFAGTLCGIIAAALVSLVSQEAGLLPRGTFGIPMSAGILGMLLDSCLGALCERRGWMGNDAVNFSSTLFAALLAAVFGHFLS